MASHTDTSDCLCSDLLNEYSNISVNITYCTAMPPPVCIYSDEIFGVDVEALTSSVVTGVFRDYLNVCQDYVHITTVVSVI